MKETTQISIFKIKDSFCTKISWDSAKDIADKLFSRTKKQLWKIESNVSEEFWKEKDPTKKKLQLIPDDKTEFKYTFFKKYIKINEEQIRFYENVNLDEKDYASKYIQPSLIHIFKDAKNTFIITIGNASSLIKDEVIDTQFPVKFTFQFIKYMKEIPGAGHDFLFKNIKSYNYLNGISLKNSIKREEKNIETIKSSAKSFREIVSSGSVQFKKSGGITQDSMQFQFLYKEPSINFSNKICFYYKYNKDETLFKLIQKISKLYDPTKENGMFPFVDYFNIVSEEREANELFEKMSTNLKDTYLCLTPELQEKLQQKNISKITLIIKDSSKYVYKTELNSYHEINDEKSSIFKEIKAYFDNGKDWARFRGLSIVMKDADDITIDHKIRFIEILESFLENEGKFFFVNNEWYRLNDQLLDLVEKEYEARKINDVYRDIKNFSPIEFENKTIKHEALFNWKLNEALEDSVLVDAVNIGYKSSLLELSDLIKFSEDDDGRKTVELIFVKLDRSAHNLSALFGQVLNTKEIIGRADSTLFKELLEKYKSKKQHRTVGKIKYDNFYYINEEDRIKKIEILEKIIENYEEITFKYKVIFVGSAARGELSVMARNNLLNFIDNLNSLMKTSEDWEICELSWKPEAEKYSENGRIKLSKAIEGTLSAKEREEKKK